PVDVPEQAEGAAFGAALQAMWAVERASGGDADLSALAAAHVQPTRACPRSRTPRRPRPTKPTTSGSSPTSTRSARSTRIERAPYHSRLHGHHSNEQSIHR